MAISTIDNSGLSSTAAIDTSKLGTGAVLQVVQSTYATTSTFNSTGPVDLGLSASITPKSSSSKILVLLSIPTYSSTGSGDVYMRFYIVRGSTTISSTAYQGVGSSSTAAYHMFSFNYLDSPGTTSAVTYQIQMCNSGGSSYPSFVNRPANSPGVWEMSGASSLILMEVL